MVFSFVWLLKYVSTVFEHGNICAPLRWTAQLLPLPKVVPAHERQSGRMLERF